MHIARGLHEGNRIKFRARAFLRLIGRHTGNSERQWLKSIFDDLTATSVAIADPQAKRLFWGSLLPRGAAQDEDDDTLFVVEISRDLVKLFDRGFTQIDWEQRRALLRKPLALWLQLCYASHVKPHPYSVTYLHEQSGSTTKSLKAFRQNLRLALDTIKAAGVIFDWRIDENTDLVHTTRIATPSQQRHLIQSNGLAPRPADALPIRPRLTTKAYSVFNSRYNREDIAACIADWHTWLEAKGHTATHPDAAFLGFAKKWVLTH